MSRPQTLVVGFDGSESSARALDRAASLAGYGTRLFVAHVVSRRDNVASSTPELDAADTILTERHVLFERRLLFGDPRSALLQLATSVGADLVIVGNGKTTLERLLSGSVSTYVVHHAPCDVMVVR